MKLLVIGLVAILAGCAGHEPDVHTVRVEMPMLIPCKMQETAFPAWTATGLKKSDSLEVKVRALLAERRQRMGYERELVAAAVACR